LQPDRNGKDVFVRGEAGRDGLGRRRGTHGRKRTQAYYKQKLNFADRFHSRIRRQKSRVSIERLSHFA